MSNLQLNKKKKQKSYSKPRYKKLKITYRGEQAQIDVTYLPNECIVYASYHSRYYQIAAIEPISKKKIYGISRRNSSYTTSEFLKRLEDKMGFEIELLQTDIGFIFVNDPEKNKNPQI